MKEILNLLADTFPDKEILTDSEIVEVYKATSEEEAEKYMKTIQDLLERYIVPEDITELCMAVSYLNIEAFLYKNWFMQK